MKNIKRIVGYSAIVALSSQINIGILNADFRVSAGAIVFALLILHYKDLKPVPMGIVSGISVYLLRVLIHFLGKGTFTEVLLSFQLEILFYAFYGIIYSLLIRRSNTGNNNHLFYVLIASDISANIIEIFARVVVVRHRFSSEIVLTLLLVAIVRSSIVWVALNWLKYYRMLLVKEEHEKRYAKLLWLTAQLKLEMYWMEKNMDNIERIMSNSYGLFEKLSLGEDKDSWSDRALTIAKDVHEIKKEYGLAIRGIKELTEDKLEDKGMKLKDIIKILEESMKREIIHLNKNIEFFVEIGQNFYTSKHYYLMSILRNIVMNAIDAIPDSNKAARISFTHKIEGAHHVFTISDNGCGIDEEDLKNIFSPGFSTKINYTTGEVNRGLGLSVVQDLVESHFQGSVEVDSLKDKGTTFWVYIPRSSVEVFK